MSGGSRSLTVLNVLLVSTLLACGDDRRTGAASVGGNQIGDSAVNPRPDTVIAPAADTGVSAATRSDTAPSPSTPASEVARPTLARKAPVAVKPAAPAPRPEPRAPAPVPADTPPTASPAQATDSAASQTQATASLRDEYHGAPLDTVSQQVYDGWKQYNLNCARCHGEDVLGTTIAPHLIASLKPGGPINTEALFVQTVCDGRPEKGMPAWCPLGMEMDKIQAIHAYVKGRSDGKVRPGRPALKAEG